MNKRIILPMLVVVVVIVISVIVLNQKEEKVAITSANNNIDVKEILNEQQKCDFKIVKMGTYEQDGDTSNGPEPIEWMVIFEDTEKQLLLSKYVLDRILVSYDKSLSWEKTAGYKWLNDKFYSTAFDEGEKTQIVYSHIEEEVNGHVQESFVQPAYDAYLFYLSEEEINKCFLVSQEGNKEYKNGFVAYKTPYCESKYPYKNEEKNKQEEIYHLQARGVLLSVDWPTRTPGVISYEYTDEVITATKVNFTMVVNSSGDYLPYSNNYYYSENTSYQYGNWYQRPAMWVKK